MPVLFSYDTSDSMYHNISFNYLVN